MNLDERQELLRELCRIQATGTAPIKLGIGWTDKSSFVQDEIVIYDCPPIFINELVKKGYFVSVGDGSLRILGSRGLNVEASK